MTSIKAVLEEARKEGRLVSLHEDPSNWDRCCVGFVDAMSNSHVRLRSVTTRGTEGGFEIRPLASIAGVEQEDEDNDYLGKIRRLMSFGGAKSVESWCMGNDPIRDALRRSMDTGQIVSVWGDANEGFVLCGIVTLLSDDSAVVRTVDQYGEDDGAATVRLSSIRAIDYATEEEQIKQFLRESYAADGRV